MTSISRNYLFTLSCIAFLINSAVSSDYVPVYLWQTNKVTSNVPALPHVTSETFTEFIQEQIRKDTIVVSFVEPNLSPEDFSAVTASGQQVFTHLSELRSGASTAYLPLVQEPVGAIKKLFSADVATVQAKDFDVESVKTPALIVDLNDIEDDEDRTSMLTRHDATIANIYTQLSKKYTNVVALFTGLEASWVTPEDVLNRKVRDTQQTSNPKADEEEAKVWLKQPAHGLLYSSEIPKLTIGDTVYDMETYTASSTSDDGIVKITLSDTAAKPSVLMFFTVERGYWALNNVTVTNGATDIHFRAKKIQPPVPFSYQCTNQTFINGTTKWSLKNFQIQPFKDGHNGTFGDAYFCVGFTSVPIWSGLFVTFILATIMAVGLMMMLDMKTMDRFDDPKGKTIIINTAE